MTNMKEKLPLSSQVLFFPVTKMWKCSSRYILQKISTNLRCGGDESFVGLNPGINVIYSHVFRWRAILMAFHSQRCHLLNCLRRYASCHVRMSFSTSPSDICHQRTKYRAVTQREILLNYSEIRLYLPFSDWFGSKSIGKWLKNNLITSLFLCVYN